jgi:hypothetical protein
MFPLYLRPWNAANSCSFPLSDDREEALIGQAYTSHYGDPHSEEGDRPVSTCGPFEQQRRRPRNGEAWIRYTQEPALVVESPPPSPSRYIMSGQQVGAGYDKVLIPNPDYKGKDRTELASSNLTPRVQ